MSDSEYLSHRSWVVCVRQTPFLGIPVAAYSLIESGYAMDAIAGGYGLAWLYNIATVM